MVWLSGVMKWLARIAAVAAIVAFIAFQKAKHTDRVREIVDPLKLKIPVFGPLFRKVYLARMTRNLASMLSAGVPMLQALGVVATRPGRPWWLMRSPTSASRCVVASRSRRRWGGTRSSPRCTTQQLTTLIEAIMILILGAVVGSILISLYLPIFKIFDLVRA